MSEDFIGNCVWSRGFTGIRFVAYGGVVVLREVVVYCVLGSGCVGFGIGVCVGVEGILPWREWDVVRGVARLFFIKVCL
jgi:hypothetical protein